MPTQASDKHESVGEDESGDRAAAAGAPATGMGRLPDVSSLLQLSACLPAGYITYSCSAANTGWLPAALFITFSQGTRLLNGCGCRVADWKPSTCSRAHTQRTLRRSLVPLL